MKSSQLTYIVLSSLTLFYVSCAETPAASSAQCTYNYAESYGITIPERFPGDFANEDDWTDPRGEYSNLGNRQWTQIFAHGANTSQLKTIYRFVEWERGGSDTELTLFSTDLGPNHPHFRAIAKIEGDWPTSEKRSLKSAKIVSIVFENGSTEYQLKEGTGFFKDIEVSEDYKWISGKMSATFVKSGNEIPIDDSFRGGLYAKCWEGNGSDCESVRDLANSTEVTTEWLSKLPKEAQCKDHIEITPGE